MAEQIKSAAPQLGKPDETCCGGRHAPTNEGKPLGLSCQLCPESSVYWRKSPGVAARLAAVPSSKYPIGAE